MPPKVTQYLAPEPPPPKGSPIERALYAVFIERRLPYRIQVFWDRFCRIIGWRQKTVRAAGFEVRVRRGTCDEAFVQNVITNLEYNSQGYEIRSGETVVDVGANIGTFTLLASRAVGVEGRVFAFEPESENYALLRENVAHNGCLNVTAERVAVAGQIGQMTLHHANEGGFHSLHANRLSGSRSAEEVDALTLKYLLDRHGITHCDLLKVDCEGAEYEILYNLPDDCWARISKIVMEYHGIDRDTTQDRARADALATYIEGHGFHIDTYEVFPPPFRGGHLRAVRRPVLGSQSATERESSNISTGL
jgi:FkbM family methyltransferase